MQQPLKPSFGRVAWDRSWVAVTLRVCACAALVSYLAWNAYWILRGRIAPSMFTAMTSLPCPTTGGTRSLRCLFAGQWLESIRYNAMTIPIILLLAYSVLRMTRHWIASRRVMLSQRTWYAWAGILGLAWLLKLMGNPAYW